jgi:hypothetical protein
MGATPRFGLRWPELTDAPNGPAQFEALAEDSDAWLCRAYRCTSTTRPSGVPNDFIIRESDTGNVYIWTGSAWAQISGAVASGGSGSGGTSAIGTVSATYAATAAQSISAGSDIVVAFAVAQTTDANVTRATSGAGHSFTLGQTRLWTISTTLRFVQDPTGGRTFELRAGTTVLAKEGGDAPANTPFTANLSTTRALPAGTVITAIARHNSSTSLALDPNAGNYVHIDLAGV